MDYHAAFKAAVDDVRAEGRYRVFADLKRHNGNFPLATWTTPGTLDICQENRSMVSMAL